LQRVNIDSRFNKKLQGSKTMRKFARILAAAFFVFAQSVSYAQSAQWCGGTISYALADGGGMLMAVPSFRNDWIVLCSVNAAYNNISPTVCKSWQAIVQNAIATQQSTVIFLTAHLPVHPLTPTHLRPQLAT
jgi:hypothetical protein